MISWVDRQAAHRRQLLRTRVKCCDLIRERGFRVATGQFGATMQVEIHNDGPVTIVLSTDAWS